MKAIEIVEQEPERREKLWENIECFRSKSPQPPFDKGGRGGICSPIIPFIVGSSEKAVADSRKLFEQGFWVGAIRYPTVAKGTERLRITLMASHTEEQIKSLSEALNELR